MIFMPQCVAQWNTEHFQETFKDEVRQLDPHNLPLQSALKQSSVAVFNDIELVYISAVEDGGFIHIKAGVFYQGLVAGCNCADDPSPDELNNEYCELLFEINTENAATVITLLDQNV